VKGIEPSSSAWKAVALPLSYTRLFKPGSFRPPSPRLRPTPFAAPSDQPAPKAVDDSEGWWRGLDSNQRRLSQRIYSPSPLATRAPLRFQNFLNWRKYLRTSDRPAHKPRSAWGTNAKNASERFGCGRWLFVNWKGVSIEDYRGKPVTWPRGNPVDSRVLNPHEKASPGSPRSAPIAASAPGSRGRADRAESI
jgi:hypothetical protein